MIRVFADDKQPRLTQGLKLRRYKNREFEAFTISWLPSDFMTNPDLCVFKGTGARLFAKANKCPLSPGRNFTLEETIKLAANEKSAVAMWGPYEIDKKAFDLAVKRKRLLDAGTIKYRADDRLYRKDRVAINCSHAIAGLNELFPDGGIFGTGFEMWGLNGTSRVLSEYTEKANIKGVLLGPVDEKKTVTDLSMRPPEMGTGFMIPSETRLLIEDNPSVSKVHVPAPPDPCGMASPRCRFSGRSLRRHQQIARLARAAIVGGGRRIRGQRAAARRDAGWCTRCGRRVRLLSRSTAQPSGTVTVAR